jgi:predicted negative regulator of RcsB-dependent stress response
MKALIAIIILILIGWGVWKWAHNDNATQGASAVNGLDYTASSTDTSAPLYNSSSTEDSKG